jgi:L-rhamnose isomerase
MRKTDVQPLLAELRADTGWLPIPPPAYLASGYGKEISSERKAGSPAGWGA